MFDIIYEHLAGMRTEECIRHIYETVDAVKTVLADGNSGHALVFSTLAEGERLASAIPTGEGPCVCWAPSICFRPSTLRCSE